MTDAAGVGSTAPGRVPSATFRLQLQPGFDLDAAAAVVADIAALGASHVHLSPVLQAAPGSRHGYDVVDHSRVSGDLGGEQAFARLVTAARRAGLGIVLDIVPNHMAIPAPEHDNAQLWSVLRDGPVSPYAAWFDIDWEAGDGRIVLPVLGAGLDEVVASGDLALDRVGAQEVLRYHEHVLPLAHGTSGMPLPALLAAQHYRLASSREAGVPNYRRFFDVSSLIAVRVEDPAVFDQTHERIVAMVRAGELDGLRIDHPDGLADPAGYLDRLAEATGGGWVVVEKILQGDEQLPAGWACAGTTGYDAMGRVGSLFVDPAGARRLTQLSDQLLGEHQDLDQLVRAAKELVVDEAFRPELDRLLRLARRALPDLDPAAGRRALRALLVGMDTYRSYVRPGTPAPVAAVGELAALARRVTAADPSLEREVVVLLLDLALDHPVGADDAARREFCVRLQQTGAAVLAKGVEDTAWYRYVRLVGLNEVGADPGRLGIDVARFHEDAARSARSWPAGMTSLSSHDTKRSEDVRARLAVLAEWPEEWATWLTRARRLTGPDRPERLDPLTEYLLWQTFVGAWPIASDRLAGYAVKAIREAKLHTSWTDRDPGYERAVVRFTTLLTTAPAVAGHVRTWHAATAREWRANVLGQKLVQLLMPGVPDVYQGTDLVDLSLVDPDNRRLVDWAARRERLARLDAGEPPSDLSDEKLLVTARALRLRRDCPEAFVGAEGDYTPLGSASPHVVAFARGAARDPEVVVLATRLAGRLAAAGGWGKSTVALPPGRWRDVLRRRDLGGGSVPLEVVLPPSGLPVALLVRTT